MSSWGAGYVTDLSYMPGYYGEQSPLHVHIACLLGGVQGLAPGTHERLAYLELGCGTGFGALVLAASNPGWQVTGIDFNPAHVAEARFLAAACGLANVTFIEADLATFSETQAADRLGPVDVVSLHGVWSWVPQAVRHGIVRLLDRTVKPGGLVQLSYNALPAWQGVVGMQRLLRESGSRLATRSDRQARAGLEVARELNAGEARHLGGAFVQTMLGRMDRLPPAYLAHEYMNETWSPCFHADVTAALAAAKLDWVGSIHLVENFPELTLTEPQRQTMERFDEPVMRELVKDMCLERGLRQDVFVRGARRIGSAERDRALGQVMLALTCTPDRFVYEATVPIGSATLEQRFYGPIVAALGERPRTVDELMALPDLGPQPRNYPELIAMLVGSGQAIPLIAPPAPIDATAARFNAVISHHLGTPDQLRRSLALATSGSGQPLPCQTIELMIEHRHRTGTEFTEPDLATLTEGQSAEARHDFEQFIAQIRIQRSPVWRSLGLGGG